MAYRILRLCGIQEFTDKNASLPWSRHPFCHLEKFPKFARLFPCLILKIENVEDHNFFYNSQLGEFAECLSFSQAFQFRIYYSATR